VRERERIGTKKSEVREECEKQAKDMAEIKIMNARVSNAFRLKRGN
jgi:hypothetical protein